MIAKESERRAADSERRATDFEDSANITIDNTVNSYNEFPQGEQNGDD